MAGSHFDSSAGKPADVLTDFLDRATRSRVMSRIRSKDTKPELALRRGLWAAGVRGWRVHVKALPGKPDLAFRRRACGLCRWPFLARAPGFLHARQVRRDLDAEIERTKERDRLANEALAADGWVVLRLWDFEVERDLPCCIERVLLCFPRPRITGRAHSGSLVARPPVKDANSKPLRAIAHLWPLNGKEGGQQFAFAKTLESTDGRRCLSPVRRAALVAVCPRDDDWAGQSFAALTPWRVEAAILQAVRAVTAERFAQSVACSAQCRVSRAPGGQRPTAATRTPASPTSRWSSGSRSRCRSTAAASASSPATT